MRPNIPELDELINKEPIKVGHDGFVRLVDYMGSEQSIVRAARVSYGDGTKSVREDTGLLRYLMEHKHTSPFEQAELAFHCRLPIYIARQWIRHRTANVNEYSGRYSEITSGAERITEWRTQDTVNKQGSSGVLSEEISSYLSAQQKLLQDSAESVYQERLSKGVAREIARNDLPLSTYTEWYWKIDLHNLLHFLTLRMDSHAQKEIREYAEAISKFVEIGFPNIWQAHLDFNVNSVKFSAPEIKVLSECKDTTDPEVIVEVAKKYLTSKRAIRSLIEKCLKISGG